MKLEQKGLVLLQDKLYIKYESKTQKVIGLVYEEEDRQDLNRESSPINFKELLDQDKIIVFAKNYKTLSKFLSKQK